MSSGRQANRLDVTRAAASYAADEAERKAIETGVVKFYDAHKRFGFVQPEDPEKSAVFLAGALVSRAGMEELHAGDRLQYVRASATSTGAPIRRGISAC
jgi:cold shock CspA family protein